MPVPTTPQPSNPGSYYLSFSLPHSHPHTPTQVSQSVVIITPLSHLMVLGQQKPATLLCTTFRLLHASPRTVEHWEEKTSTTHLKWALYSCPLIKLRFLNPGDFFPHIIIQPPLSETLYSPPPSPVLTPRFFLFHSANRASIRSHLIIYPLTPSAPLYPPFPPVSLDNCQLLHSAFDHFSSVTNSRLQLQQSSPVSCFIKFFLSCGSFP